MRTGFFIGLMLLFVLPFPNRSHGQLPVDPVMAQQLQDKIDSCVTHYNLPGISVSLLLPGNRYWNGASGLSDIFSSVPMDTSMLFQQASVTKMFVATLVFQLAEEGMLSIEDSLGTYLPPILNVPGSTKIKYLLNMRSGIYDHIAQNPSASDTWFTDPDSIWNGQTAIETYGDAPMFAPNASFYYSNTNYVLLGMLIEQVTGHSFAQELRDRFLTPYGLTQTYMPYQDSIAGVQTPGWTSFTTAGVYDTDASVIFNDCFASMVSTAGALVSSPRDVARFTRMLHGGEILQDTSLARMKQFTTLSIGGGNGYGYGCIRYVFSGPKIYYGHAGDISGFTQFSAHHPLDSITITVSINRNNAPRIAVAQDILNIVYEQLEAGVQEHTRDAQLKVFPNPASGLLQVQSSKAVSRIELCSALGTVVLSQPLNHQPAGSQYQLDVSMLPDGMYLLKTINGDEVMAVRKVMVRK